MDAPILAVWITRQLVVDGIVSGLIIGLLAMGIVLIYRSTRVINFAVGNMGLIAASLFALLVINYGWNFWVALLLSLIVGTLFGTAMELIVVRRLFEAPRVILLIATVGIAQLAQLIIFQFPDVDAGGNRYPSVSEAVWQDALGTGVRLRGPQLTILLAVPLVAGLLGLLLNRTILGKAVAASAGNPSLSRLSGINPKVVSTVVWTIAGLLASLSMILTSGLSGSVAGLGNIGPFTLSQAMAAAVLAGMVSFTRAVVAGMLIGIAQKLFIFNFAADPGLSDGLVLVAVLIAVYVQDRNDGELASFAFAPKLAPIPSHLRDLWWVKHMMAIAFCVAAAAAVVVVWIPGLADVPSRQLLFTFVVCFAICGLSVSITTGWAGQLSLAQMTFAGFGALIAARLSNGLSMDVEIGTGFLPIDALSWDFFPIQFDASPIPVMLAIPIAAVCTAAVAAVVGLGSLRVRGLDLAVTTFVFALSAQQYLFRQPLLSDGERAKVPFERTELFGLDLTSQRRYYYVCLATLLAVLVIVIRLRQSGVGRSTIAGRDNPNSAEAYTIGLTRSKLSAFALAGGIAGLGGALLAGAVQTVQYGERFFLVGDSLSLVAMVVIGGLGSVVGPVIGAIWIHGIPGIFDDSNTVALFSSSVGLLIVLMYFPGGLVQIGHAGRSALIGFAERRLPAPPAGRRSEVIPSNVIHKAPDSFTGKTVLATSGITVRFGGVTAVDGATIDVSADEIVGLIGTNGAGKSTLMNAIGGFVPADGRVELRGRDISGLGASARASVGLGRTFQAAKLFPELTVRETVQVALEGRGRTPMLATALHLPRANALESRRRSEASDLVDFLGLGRYADTFISDLSTGTRRIVELAGLLALDARVLCLDEPTAGVAQREAEAFGPLIKSLRKELGAAVLIVEHDMPLIMSMSDRVYCLEAGRVIAEGTPEAVRNDPAVIASYLGTDDRAIDRSDA